MFEFDFLPVGDGEKSGDAIALRYTHPETGGYVTGIIDAGFEDDGDALVDHFADYYGTDSVDFVISTHPDADHINGMGKVMRRLNVGTLLIHRPAQHCYPQNSGAKAAEELARRASSRQPTPPDDSGLEPLGAGIPDVARLAESPFHEDNAEANGTSIVVLAEFDQHALLLCGDAWPSVVSRGVERLLEERDLERLPSSRTSTRQSGFLRCSASTAASPGCSAASGPIGSLVSRT